MKDCFSGENLTCVRGNSCVFTKLFFSVKSGEGLILKGANGSGKSSLLRLMTGLLKPVDGEIKWNQKNVLHAKEEHNKRFQFVGHINPIKPIFTVYENILFWSQLREKDPRIEHSLNLFGISHLRDVSCHFLSSGQIRLTNLARITATSANIWLLDEPASSLDQGAVENLEKAIRDHQHDGGIVIASTHTKIEIQNAHELLLSEFLPNRVSQ